MAAMSSNRNGSPRGAQITHRGKLSDAEWRAVFQLRCKSKSGSLLSKAEQALVEAACQEDETRYGDMAIDVFNATVPFGSKTRRSAVGPRGDHAVTATRAGGFRGAKDDKWWTKNSKYGVKYQCSSCGKITLGWRESNDAGMRWASCRRLSDASPA